MKNFNMNNLHGVDACIETSLFEYGFAWIESNDKKEILFYYGIDHEQNEYNSLEYSTFDFCTFDRYIDVYKEFNWADFSDIFSYTGMDKKEWNKTTFQNKIYDLLNYYGYENIFGASYWHGLKYNANINRFQAIKIKG